MTKKATAPKAPKTNEKKAAAPKSCKQVQMDAERKNKAMTSTDGKQVW